MQYSVSHTDSETTLIIEGELDANTAPELRGTLNLLVESSQHTITVDLSGLRLIDSSGVGALVSLYKRARANGRRMRVIGMVDQPAAIFRLLRLDTVLARA